MSSEAIPSRVSSDPEVKLTNVLLNDMNYLPWSRAITIALGGRAKLQHIEDDPPKTTESTYMQWRIDDYLVMSWLFKSMDPKIYELFMHAENARELWTSVKEMYSQQDNAARIFELQNELSNLKQGASQSMTEYLTQIKKIWEELRLYRPPTTDPKELLRREEQDKLFQLLKGVKEEHHGLRSQILRTTPLPSVTTTFTLLFRDETSQKVMGTKLAGDNTDARAFLIKTDAGRNNGGIGSGSTRGRGRGRGNGSRPYYFCTHCNKAGHSNERCWELHPHLRRDDSSGKMAAVADTSDPPEQEQSEVQLLREQVKQLEFHIKGIGSSSTQQASIASVAHTSGKPSTFLSTCNSDIWLVDSGATDNMTPKSCSLSDVETRDPKQAIGVANGTRIPVKGIGKMEIFSSTTDVLFVPSLSSNLLSVSKITKQLKCRAIFSPYDVVFQDLASGMILGEGKECGGLYVMDTNSLAKVFHARVDKDQESLLWHRRTGHPSDKILQLLDSKWILNSNKCDACHFSKEHRLPFSNSLTTSLNPFEIVHSDIWGPASLVSHDGFRYFVTFIDDFSRTTWVYLMKAKSDMPSAFENFCSFVTTQFDSKIKTLRTDNGAEYTSRHFSSILSARGILHQTTCVGTPQQNGVAERKNRHLLEVTRCLLFQMNVPKIFWSDAVLTSCYVINRLPTKVLNSKSPIEVLRGTSPNISHLRVFGCLCYVHLQDQGKLEPRSRKCIFVGYSSTQKGYRCYHPQTKKLIISRDVTFIEDEPFFPAQLQGETLGNFEVVQSSPQPEPVPINPYPISVMGLPGSLQSPHQPSEGSPITTEQSVAQQPQQPQENMEETLRPKQLCTKSGRVIQPPLWQRDYHIDKHAHTVTSPIQNYISYDNISMKYASFLANLDKEEEPKSYEEAKTSPTWIKAMNDELSALSRNHTWDI